MADGVTCSKCFVAFTVEELADLVKQDRNGDGVLIEGQRSAACPACGNKAIYREIDNEEGEPEVVTDVVEM